MEQGEASWHAMLTSEDNFVESNPSFHFYVGSEVELRLLGFCGKCIYFLALYLIFLRLALLLNLDRSRTKLGELENLIRMLFLDKSERINLAFSINHLLTQNKENFISNSN